MEEMIVNCNPVGTCIRESHAGARFTKNLETILRLSYNNDQTYDKLKIILWQCDLHKNS